VEYAGGQRSFQAYIADALQAV